MHLNILTSPLLNFTVNRKKLHFIYCRLVEPNRPIIIIFMVLFTPKIEQK